MKPIAQLRMALVVMGLVAVRALQAADTSVSVERPETKSAMSDAFKSDLPEIKLPANVDLPDALKGLAADFRTEAQKYVERQKVLSQRAEQASATERERIREQIKANRTQFLQQTRQIRSEIKDRIREIHRTIGNSRPLDGAGMERGTGDRRRR